MKRFLLIALVMSASAFAPRPPDPRTMELCNSTGGMVNVTVFDPDSVRPQPGMDRAPMTIMNCVCPANTIWDDTSGCRITTTTVEAVPLPGPPQSLIERIISFIKGMFWFLR